jgi:hypothetical protein
MRVPQVSERIKEAPAQALRGVFAGIGQLLLYTDKLRNKVPYAHVPMASPSPPASAPATKPTAPVPDRTAAASAPADRDVAAEPAAAEAPKTSTAPKTPKVPAAPKTPTAATEIRDFDKTGNVRLITADEARKDDEPTVGGQAPASAGEPAAGPAQAGSPLPNYDELSVASLRARLRNLDVTQVRGLVEYEKAHAGRADVIVMFERRIAKLEAGD